MNNLNNKGLNDDPLDFIKKLKTVEAKRSKAEVWAELEKMLEQPVQKEGSIRFFNIKTWRVAASIVFIMLLSSFFVARFYKTTIAALPGTQGLAVLPDGSEVQLNAVTEISYKPFWWYFNREVKLNGEAYFKVKKGKKFTVVSDYGQTSVVGTSFNIQARGSDYNVTCLTGKVKVLSTKTNEEVLITPNQMAGLTGEGNINLNLNVNAKLATDWTIGKFIFTQVPLDKVISEISRRYGVEINNLSNLNDLYTGNFNKEIDIELVLKLVCKPFELDYKKLPSGAYAIQKSE